MTHPGDDPDEPDPGNTDKPTKRTRGRPRLPLEHVHDPVGQVEGLWAREKLLHPVTRRQILNLEYEGRALEALTSDGQGHHSGDELYELYYRVGQIVQTELGRFGGREAIRDAAWLLLEAIEEGTCSDRAQDQEALLRHWRREKGLPLGTIEQLQQALEQTIQRYQAQHDGVADEMVIEALARAYWAHKNQ
jgi:hypothetical protein